MASARQGFVLGPLQTVVVARYSPPPRTITSLITASSSRSLTPGAIAFSNAASMSITIEAFTSSNDELLWSLDATCFLGDRRGVSDRDASALERDERRRSEPVDGERSRSGAELPDGGQRLIRPSVCLGLWIVEELPRMHRTNVRRTKRRPMHRVRVLEQDRRSLLWHDRASNERAHRVDGHRARAGRVADVRLVEEHADLDRVVAHRRLQPGQSFEPERLDVVRRHRSCPMEYHELTRPGGVTAVRRSREPFVRSRWPTPSPARRSGNGWDRPRAAHGRRASRAFVRRPARRTVLAP